MKLISILAFISLLSAGCASRDCKPDTSKPGALTGEAKEQVEKIKKDANLKTVKVFKFDGSLQCNQGKPISAETMKAELGDIPVMSFEKRHDGLMRTQVCGTPTGQCNVFEIPEDQLEKAKAKGFKLWKNN